jgi:cell division septation protein DedD
MSKIFLSSRRAAAVGAAVLIAVATITAVAVASGIATSSRVKTATIKCPRAILGGRKVTCKVLAGSLRGPEGPRGPAGAKGTTGAKGAKGSTGSTGAKGATGAAGAPGVSGYEVVSQTFKGLPVPHSGTQRGLSEAKTVSCPSGKRVLSGGTNLGTDEGQGEQQSLVTLSMSAPNGAGTGWSAQLFNTSTSEDAAIDLRIYAVCARVN